MDARVRDSEHGTETGMESVPAMTTYSYCTKDFEGRTKPEDKITTTAGGGLESRPWASDRASLSAV